MDEMINSTKKFNKSSGTPGIGDTVKLMDEYDMNQLNDSIGPNQRGSKDVEKYSKNS